MTTDNLVCKTAKIFTVLFLGVLFVTAFTMTNCAWAQTIGGGGGGMIVEPGGDGVIIGIDSITTDDYTVEGYKQNGSYDFNPDDWDDFDEWGTLTVFVGSEVSQNGTVVYGANTVNFNSDFSVSELYLFSGNISVKQGSVCTPGWIDIDNMGVYFSGYGGGEYPEAVEDAEYLSTLTGVFETDWFSLDKGSVKLINNGGGSNLKTYGFSLGNQDSGLIMSNDGSEFSATVNNVTFTTVDGPFIKVNEGGSLVFDNAISLSSDEYNTLKVCCEASGLVSPEGVFISSGRVDIKGVIEGNLEVEEGATFSPGNSVGTTEVEGGNFILGEDAILLLEIGGQTIDLNDQVIADSAEYLDGSTIRVVLDPESGFEPEYYQDIYVNLPDVDTLYEKILSNDVIFSSSQFNVVGTKDGALVLNRAVPEPSTWALLVLGAAGMLYLRKKNA